MTKSDFKQRIEQLEMEYKQLAATPKRWRQFNHETELAMLQGRIYELKFLLTVWPDEMTVPNLNEQ